MQVQEPVTRGFVRKATAGSVVASNGQSAAASRMSSATVTPRDAPMSAASLAAAQWQRASRSAAAATIEARVEQLVNHVTLLTDQLEKQRVRTSLLRPAHALAAPPRVHRLVV